MSDAGSTSMPCATVEFCGEHLEVDPDLGLVIGREGALEIDDNPYLHRRFLEISAIDGMWWLVNVGSQLTATVSDIGGGVQAWLAPGARLPLVFHRTSVRFTAGPTAYEMEVTVDNPPFAESALGDVPDGEATIGPVPLTDDQRLLIVALAESILSGGERGASAIPSNAAAAQRLGWTPTRFNRKLDNVCQKLAKVGVQGLHGDAGSLASNRRARLIEYAIAARLVTKDDLPMLDQQSSGS